MANPQYEEALGRLIRQAQNDETSLKELVADYLPSLRAFVRSRLGPELRLKESASDLMQSVCREILTEETKFEFRGETAFRSWLFTAALNKIRERNRYYRQEKRDIGRETPPAATDEQHLLRGYSSVCTPSHQVSAAEQVAILEQAMDELEPDHRDVIAYARLAGMPAREIAALMDRNEGAVHALLGRALVKLAEKLRSHGLRPPGETL